jgi:hypothetical protein
MLVCSCLLTAGSDQTDRSGGARGQGGIVPPLAPCQKGWRPYYASYGAPSAGGAGEK